MNSILSLATASGSKVGSGERTKETAHHGETLEGTSLRVDLDFQLRAGHDMMSESSISRTSSCTCRRCLSRVSLEAERLVNDSISIQALSKNGI